MAVSLILNYEEGSEYSWDSGDRRNESLGELPRGMPPEYRDLRTESLYEYGSRAGVWRLLRLFERCRVAPTIFASAVALEKNPELCALLRDARYEVAAHGWRWTEPWLLEPDEERRQIDAAVNSILRTCGSRPRGWYSRYGPSVNTRRLLVAEGGFLYDSDAYNDDLPYQLVVKGKQHLVIPYTLVFNDVRYVLAQGFASSGDFFETCRAGFDYLWEEGAERPRMMSIGLHPRWSGNPARAAGLRDFIDYAQRKGGVWFAQRIQIAEHWLEHRSEFTEP